MEDGIEPEEIDPAYLDLQRGEYKKVGFGTCYTAIPTDLYMSLDEREYYYDAKKLFGNDNARLFISSEPTSILGFVDWPLILYEVTGEIRKRRIPRNDETSGFGTRLRKSKLIDFSAVNIGLTDSELVSGRDELCIREVDRYVKGLDYDRYISKAPWEEVEAWRVFGPNGKQVEAVGNWWKFRAKGTTIPTKIKAFYADRATLSFPMCPADYPPQTPLVSRASIVPWRSGLALGDAWKEVATLALRENRFWACKYLAWTSPALVALALRDVLPVQRFTALYGKRRLRTVWRTRLGITMMAEISFSS